jgi:hypothetical protein
MTDPRPPRHRRPEDESTDPGGARSEPPYDPYAAPVSLAGYPGAGGDPYVQPVGLDTPYDPYAAPVGFAGYPGTAGDPYVEPVGLAPPPAGLWPEVPLWESGQLFISPLSTLSAGVRAPGSPPMPGEPYAGSLPVPTEISTAPRRWPNWYGPWGRLAFLVVPVVSLTLMAYLQWSRWRHDAKFHQQVNDAVHAVNVYLRHFNAADWQAIGSVAGVVVSIAGIAVSVALSKKRSDS